MAADPQRRFPWGAVVRCMVALGFIALVLFLVPLRDRLAWGSRLGPDAWVGRMEWQAGSTRCRFVAADGKELTLVQRGDSSDRWTHWIPGSGPDAGTEVALTQEERRELAAEPEQGLITTLRRLKPVPFLWAVLLYLGGAGLSFWRWHLLLAAVQVRASMSRVFKLGFLGLFFSNIIPGVTGGDLVKAIYVARDHPGQRPEAVLSVLVDRAIGLFALAVIASVALLFNYTRFRDLALSLYGLLGVLCLGCCVLFSRRLRRGLKLDRILGRLPAAEVLRKLDRAVLVYRDRFLKVAVSFAMSLGVHCFVLTSMSAVGAALELEVPSYWLYFALAPLPLILQAVPIAPAGIGVGEYAFVWIFATRAQIWTAQQALALALAYRAVQFSISLIGGLFLWSGSEGRLRREELDATPSGAPVPSPEGS